MKIIMSWGIHDSLTRRWSVCIGPFLVAHVDWGTHQSAFVAISIGKGLITHLSIDSHLGGLSMNYVRS